MRLLIGGSRLAAAAAVAVSVGFVACGDLFHGTDWSSKCDTDPNAPGCPQTTSSGATHPTSSGTSPGAGGNGGTSGNGGGGSGGCGAQETQCGGKCVDTRTDPKHCGSCNGPCMAGETCVASQCQSAVSCHAIKTASPTAPSGIYSIDPDGGGPLTPFQVYCDMTTQGGGLTLVLKLAANQFCFGSSRWTDDLPFNEPKTLTAAPPMPGEYDAKSAAFYELSDTTQLLFTTTTGSVTTSFAAPASPKVLMTTQTIAFASYPNRAEWVVAFSHDRNQAPIFMRGGVAEVAGNMCRTNPAATPVGCGQPCVFCYQASDGNCCGCDATVNDTNSGVGNNLMYCGAGLANCSTAGTFSNPNEVTLVWAR